MQEGATLGNFWDDMSDLILLEVVRELYNNFWLRSST